MAERQRPMTDAEIEVALRAAAVDGLFPPTPDIAAAVGQRLRAGPAVAPDRHDGGLPGEGRRAGPIPIDEPIRLPRPASSRWRRFLVAAAALLLVVGALLALSPRARTVVADRLGLRGVDVIQVPFLSLPTPTAAPVPTSSVARPPPALPASGAGTPPALPAGAGSARPSGEPPSSAPVVPGVAAPTSSAPAATSQGGASLNASAATASQGKPPTSAAPPSAASAPAAPPSAASAPAAPPSAASAPAAPAASAPAAPAATAATASAAPAASTTAASASIGRPGAGLGLGEPVSIEAALALTDIAVARPSLAGFTQPDAVYVAPGAAGTHVAFVYAPRPGLPATAVAGVGLLLTQFRGDLAPEFMGKMLGPGTTATELRVNGQRGLWIAGAPHLVLYRDPSGNIRDETVRLAGNVLLWERAGVLMRIEAALGRDDVARIAESVR